MFRSLKKLLRNSERTFLEHIKPALFLGKIFGNIFFSLKDANNVAGQVQNFLYLLPFQIVYAKWSCIAMWKFYRRNILNDGPALRLPDIMCLFTSTIMVYMKIIYYIKQRNEYKGLILQINDVNESLGNIAQMYRFESILNGILWFMLILVANVVSLTHLSGRTSALEVYLCIAVGNQICVVEHFLQRHICQEMSKQLKYINEELKKNIEKFQLNILINRNQKVAPRISKFVSDVNRNLFHQVITLTRIHNAVVKTALCWNEMFAISILASFAISFVVLVSCTRGMTSFMRAKVNGIDHSFKAFVTTTGWTVINFGYIVRTIQMWVDVANKANKTSTYIHDIWNTLASRDEIDDRSKHLQLLSLQLYNAKLHFTAYGFFALDWTLLHKIVGAVTTYVVILTQFEISASSKNTT